MLFLKNFFGDPPNVHSNELKMWRDVACSKNAYRNKKLGPAPLLFIYQQNMRLLECCYLMWLAYENVSLLENYNKMYGALGDGAEEHWLWFPGNLTNKELFNPYLTIKKIFKKISLDQYRRELDEWIRFGLSKDTMYQDEIWYPVDTIYESVLKLQSAAWLIWQTESGKPYLKPAEERDEAFLAEK